MAKITSSGQIVRKPKSSSKLPSRRPVKTVYQTNIDVRCKSLECSKEFFLKAISTIRNVVECQSMVSREGIITIHVIQSDKVFWYDRKDFILMFRSMEEKKYMFYMTSSYVVMSHTELDPEKGIVYHATEYLETLLFNHQETLKSLRIKGDVLNLMNFGTMEFHNLEEISLIGNFSILPCVSKAQNILKKLVTSEGEHHNLLENWKNIFEVRDTLIMPELKLNWMQFLRMSASTLHIHIGSLTAWNIFEFINNWKKGNVPKVVKTHVWHLDQNTNFNVIELLKNLNKLKGNSMIMAEHKQTESSQIVPENADDMGISIRQDGTGKMATFTSSNEMLNFIVF